MVALESAYRRALVGVPEISLAEIRGQLSEPGFDPGKDASPSMSAPPHR